MFLVAFRLVMFRINERKVSLGQKGVIKRYLSQLLGSSRKRLKAYILVMFLHFIVFFFTMLCMFFALLSGRNFSKFLSMTTCIRQCIIVAL